MSLIQKLKAAKAAAGIVGKPTRVMRSNGNPAAVMAGISAARRPRSLAEQVAKRAKPNRPKLHNETARVCAIRQIDPMAITPGERRKLERLVYKPGAALRLRPVQEAALVQIMKEEGGFLPIGVGHGKTLIGFLAGPVMGADLTIYLVPPSCRVQLGQMYAEALPSFRFGKVSIVPYSQLSRATGTDLLEQLLAQCKPGAKIVIFADEGHMIKRAQSARTKRLARFIKAHPETRVIVTSGTLTSKGLRDFSHLADWALRQRSPLPRLGDELVAWSACIDVDGQPGPMDWQHVEPLFQWATGIQSMNRFRGDERKKKIRHAFQKRLRSAPGVVATKEGSLGSSLLIQTLDLELPGAVVAKLLEVADGIQPDGDGFFPDDISQWRSARQLACGFYYRWAWEKTDKGEKDHEWLDARSDWNRRVREILDSDRAVQGYDSPFLVASRVIRQLEADPGLANKSMLHWSWAKWAEQKQKDPPPVETVWIDRFMVRDAVEWARKQRQPAILWYQSTALGEALREAGLPVYGAGSQAQSFMPNPQTCAMSIKVHGVGLDGLQYWPPLVSRIMEPPSSGKVWEQLLGRTHRGGQKADVVTWQVYQHCESFGMALKTARADAHYIEDAFGNVQKLNFATFDEQ